MNILFLADNFPPEKNAQASRVYERARHWVEWGHCVTVITCVPNFPEGRVYAGYNNRWYQTEFVSGIRVVACKDLYSRQCRDSSSYPRLYLLSSLEFVRWTSSAAPRCCCSHVPLLFAAISGWALARFQTGTVCDGGFRSLARFHNCGWRHEV